MRRAGLLLAAAISGVWWLLGAGGNLQFARDLFRERAHAVAWLGDIIASPYSGASVTVVCLLAFAGLVAHDKWWPKESQASIKVALQKGTARMGPLGSVHKVTADILVSNLAGPFTLVAHARLSEVSGGFKWTVADKWGYEPRLLRGGADSQCCFHMATTEVDKASGDWIVAVRAEHMTHVQRWVGRGPLWFDIEWSFFNDVKSTLHLIDTKGVRVLLADDGHGFVMNFKP